MHHTMLCQMEDLASWNLRTTNIFVFVVPCFWHAEQLYLLQDRAKLHIFVMSLTVILLQFTTQVAMVSQSCPSIYFFYSATWPKGVQRMADQYMKDPVRVFVGSLDLNVSASSMCLWPAPLKLIWDTASILYELTWLYANILVLACLFKYFTLTVIHYADIHVQVHCITGPWHSLGGTYNVQCKLMKWTCNHCICSRNLSNRKVAQKNGFQGFSRIWMQGLCN